MFNMTLFGIKNGLSNYAADVTLIVLFALFTVITVLVAVWLINLSIKRKKSKLRTNQLFGIMLVVTIVGVVLRIVASLLVIGHRMEYNAIAGEDGIVWKIINDGFAGHYKGSEDGMFYPLPLYLFSLFATLGSWFGVNSASSITPLLIKMPLILADIGCIVLLYKVGKKYFNHVTAVVISGLYSLCPVFMFSSAFYGSIYSILAFLLLLTFFLLAERKFLLSIIAYSFALLTAKEAIFLFPVIAIFFIYRFIKSVKFNKEQRRTKRRSLGELFKSPEGGLVLRLPLYFLLSLIGMYLFSLPFIIKDYNANFFIWLSEFYIKSLARVNYYSYNSLSLYNIFNMNGSFFGTNLVPLFVVLFLGIVVALTLMYYLSKKNRANLVLLGAYVYMTLSIFFVDFREITAMPVLAILLLAFILIKDKRLLQIFLTYSLVFILNASIVMAYGGYFNNIAESVFLTSNEYTNSGALLNSGVGKALNIVFSAIAVLVYLHFTFVLMDITMNLTRKPFEGQERLSPLTALRHWIKR